MKRYEIRIYAKDRERGQAMAIGLEAWQMIFGGTTTMHDNLTLAWSPDDEEHAGFDPMTMLVDRMVEFGVFDPTRETWNILEVSNVSD